MKKNKLVIIAAVVVALAMAAPSAFAITSAQRIAIKKAVTSVPVAEMPAKAAQLVQDATKEDREGVAVAAVRAGIYKSRSSARLMVSAVVKAAPEVAAAVTREASEMEAGQAGYIASAAINASPSSKTEIVTAANHGVSMANSGGSATMAVTSGTTTTTPVSPVMISPSGFTARSAMAVRGMSAAPATAPVQQSQTPINGGSFAGYQAQQAGNPTVIDYTQPRQ